MKQHYPSGMDARRRRNRAFGVLVRSTSILPALFMLVLLFLLVDWSMGAVAEVDGRVAAHWNLIRTVFRPDQIRAQAPPGADIGFRFWISPSFLSSSPSSSAEDSGLVSAAAGTMWILLLGLLFAFPPALAAAMWSYGAREGSATSRLLGKMLETYRRIPHVVLGICALALFGWAARLIPGGPIRTVGNAGILMGLVLLPRLTVMMRDEMAGIPADISRASFALGAAWPSVAFRQILPLSIGMIGAGTLRIAADAVGLASPFIVLGAASFMPGPPSGVQDRFTAVSVQIFQWAMHPEGVYRSLASAAVLCLLVVISALYAAASVWRRHILRAREGLR